MKIKKRTDVVNKKNLDQCFFCGDCLLECGCDDKQIKSGESGLNTKHYLEEAYAILKEEYEDWTIKDVIEVAKIISEDCSCIMICEYLDGLRESIDRISKD